MKWEFLWHKVSSLSRSISFFIFRGVEGEHAYSGLLSVRGFACHKEMRSTLGKATGNTHIEEERERERELREDRKYPADRSDR